MKNNIVMLFSLLVSDYFGCLYYFPSRCRSHFSFFSFFFFLISFNVSVSEQHYQVLVCILKRKEHFCNKIISICRLFCFVSPALHMLNTERRRDDVHVLFGDISYDFKSAHWRLNNKMKRKILFFSEYYIKIFISCNENI